MFKNITTEHNNIVYNHDFANEKKNLSGTLKLRVQNKSKHTPANQRFRLDEYG